MVTSAAQAEYVEGDCQRNKALRPPLGTRNLERAKVSSKNALVLVRHMQSMDKCERRKPSRAVQELRRANQPDDTQIRSLKDNEGRVVKTDTVRG